MIKKCVICGNEFEAKRAAITCSKKCRDKQYYLEHKDEELERRKQYYLEHKDKILERMNQYYLEHEDEELERRKQYYLEHKDKILERKKQYYSIDRLIIIYLLQIKAITKKDLKVSFSNYSLEDDNVSAYRNKRRIISNALATGLISKEKIKEILKARKESSDDNE